MPFPACPSFSRGTKSAPSSGSTPQASQALNAPLPLRPTFFSPWGHYTFRDPCHPLVELSCPLLSHLLVSLPGMSSHPLKKLSYPSTMDLKCQLFQEAPQDFSDWELIPAFPFSHCTSSVLTSGLGGGWGWAATGTQPETQPRALHLPQCPGLWSLWGTQEQSGLALRASTEQVHTKGLLRYVHSSDISEHPLCVRQSHVAALGILFHPPAHVEQLEQ